jgi:hypothetical protein
MIIRKFYFPKVAGEMGLYRIFIVKLYIACLLLAGTIAAQTNEGPSSLININPDPNGEPWIAGGISRESWSGFLAKVPALTISRPGLGKTALAPPDKVDNSIYPSFRPVFNQKGGSCSQASGIGYIYTYEINYFRGLPSNTPENQYPYDYTYNFLNSGSGNNGALSESGWNIVKALGVPNVQSYGGFGLGKFNQWVSGYDIYYNAMTNRLSEIFKINVSTPAGITQMKQWLFDHQNGSSQGGCLVQGYNASGEVLGTIPAGLPEAGKKIMYKFGTGGGHAVTIAGFNDSVRYDYNGDGKYTNNVDLNGDGKIDVKDWEIGAYLMVNSWGTTFGNTGKVWIPYRMLADPSGVWGSSLSGLKTPSEKFFKPLLTYKITLSHTQRNQIRIRAGYASSAAATAAAGTPKNFSGAFNYSGGVFPMQGINSDAIEIGLDVSDFAAGLTGSEASFFLLIDSKGGSGTVQKFSLLDYTGGPTPVEVMCPQQNVAIATGTTTLKIVKTLAQIMVLTPNGGELWERDRTYPISWFDRLTENVKIELVKGGAVAATISASAPSTGTYQWTIPADMAIGADYKLRISSVNNASVTDMSDNNFSIQAKSILEVVSPNGGEYLEKGKATTITWNGNLASNVKIDLYKFKILDTTIAANVTGNGPFTWNVPGNYPSGFEYTLRITAVNNAWLYDESNGYFGIVNQITTPPYIQNFDAFKDTTVAENWEQGADDDLNWTVWKGPTSSKSNPQAGGTGPNGDHTSGTGKYIYLEASSENHPGKTAVLLSPEFDISHVANAQIGFWCHMFSKGAHMGELWMDVNLDGVWKDSVLYLTGDHGDAWFEKNIQVSDVVSASATAVPPPKMMQVRFRGKTGSDYDSDICLDDIKVSGTPVWLPPVGPVAFTQSKIVRTGTFIKYHNVNGTIHIFSLSGVKIMQMPVKGSGVFDISGLPRGVYLAKAGNEQIKFARY